MRPLTPLAAALSAAFLVSCATAPSNSGKSSAGVAVADGELHHFSYVIDNAKSVGLVQALDSGGLTYLQTFGARAPVIRAAPNGPPIAYERRGDYLVVPGQANRLYVSEGAQTAVVKRITRSTVMMQNFRAAGVVQAFHDGDLTYVQTYSDAQPEVRSAPNGPPLEYQRSGEYLIVPGAHKQLYVNYRDQRSSLSGVPAAQTAATPVAGADSEAATVTKPDAASAAPTKIEVTGTAATDAGAELALQLTQQETDRLQEQLQHARNELERTRAVVEQLKRANAESLAELERARTSIEQWKQSLAESARLQAETPKRSNAALITPASLPQIGGRYLLHFKPHSAVFATEEKLLAATLPAVMASRSITLRGRIALGETPSLARERAVAARQLLIARGVDPNRVRVYSSAGLYIADNASEEGRAMNRRVEIDLGIRAPTPKSETMTRAEPGVKLAAAEPFGVSFPR